MAKPSVRGLVLGAWVLLAGFQAPSQALEVRVPPAEEIVDQGDYPYCGLYAMSSFLELWGKAVGKERVPGMDPGFIGAAYNAEVSSGLGGTTTYYLMYVVQKYGIVPTGARLAEPKPGVAWPIADWRDRHKELMPLEMLSPLLGGEYVHDSFSGKRGPKAILQEKVGIDFRDFIVLTSRHRERYRPSEEKVTVHYREKNEAETDKAVVRKAVELGLKDDVTPEDPDLLYSLTVAQLYRKRPVLLALAYLVTKDYFSGYHVIDAPDLLPEGEGTSGSHIGVITAHCHKTDSRDPICRRFGPLLKEKNIPECIVFQNSWGSGAHADGYVCLTRRALQRMLRHVVLPREIF